MIGSGQRSWIELVVRIAAVLSMLAGAAVLLIDAMPSLPAPADFHGSYGASLATLLGGLTLLSSTWTNPARRRVARAGGVLMLAVSLLGFFSALLAVPARKAPWFSLSGSLAFSLLGVALLTLDGRSRAARRIVAWSAGTAAVLGWLSLVLGLYVPAWGLLRFPAMSDFAAAFALVLALGILGLEAHRHWPEAVRARGAGPVLLRILVPLVVLVPTALGWLNMHLANEAIESHGLGLAVMVVANGTLVVVLVVVGARALTTMASERESARRRFEIFFDRSLVLQCIAGFDGYFKRINPVWEDVLGFTRKELLSKPFIEFVHPDDREATIDRAKGLAGGRDIVEFENRYLCPDGRVRWLRWSATSSTAEEFIFASAIDVTVEKAFKSQIEDSNRRLKSANRELEAFSYSVSHDLRAPVRAIDGFARMIEEDYADRLDDEGQRFLRVIRGETARMGRLIEDLLSFSRLSRREITSESVDLGLSTRAIFENLRCSLPGREIELNVREAPLAFGDRAMLEVVLTNLMSNAVKFTGPRSPGRIEFGGEIEGEETVYWMRDNGVGFDMTHADKLFRVFQRLHRTDDFEGTGVGLAIVERVIARHGGRVWASSSVGEGAEFRFSLPVGEVATYG